MKFNNVSKIIEIEVAEHYFKKTKEVVFVPVGYYPKFDGITQSHSLSFEVKVEAKALDTHNLSFEYYYKGKPSGLATTGAIKWITAVPLPEGRFCCYEFNVKQLRTALKNFPLYKGGDNKNSQMKLLPVQTADTLTTDKYFITIDFQQFVPYWE